MRPAASKTTLTPLIPWTIENVTDKIRTDCKTIIKQTPSRPPDGALKKRIREGFYITQLIPGIDNTIPYIIVVLIIILIPAVLFLKKTLKARSAEEGRARRQRLDYQPSAKPNAGCHARPGQTVPSTAVSCPHP